MTDSGAWTRRAALRAVDGPAEPPRRLLGFNLGAIVLGFDLTYLQTVLKPTPDAPLSP
jgi:hypothetical protein